MTTAALLLSTAAFAQQSPPASRDTTPPPAPSATMPSEQSTASLPASGLQEIKSDSKAMVPGLNVSVDKLDGMDVYGTDGKKIGDVNKVLGDSSNAVKAVTIDVGGFLGIGAQEVVLPIDRLQPGKEKDRLQTAMTKDQIKNLEKWQEPERNIRGNPTNSAPSQPTR